MNSSINQCAQTETCNQNSLTIRRAIGYIRAPRPALIVQLGMYKSSILAHAGVWS